MAGIKIERLDDLLVAAREVGPLAVAIAAPEEPEVLLAARDAALAGIALPYLVGDVQRINAVASKVGINLGEPRWKLVAVPAGTGGPAEVAKRAVELVRSGEASLLMKGKLETADLLHTVLDREGGLRNGSLLSHVALLEVPGMDRLL